MVFTEVPTSPQALSDFVDQARRAAGRRRVVWIQESTTGWARVKDLLGDRVDFQLANVVQMPLPPKARSARRTRPTPPASSASISTAACRWHTNPRPGGVKCVAWSAFRENLVARRTALRNWINRYLAHETWFDRTGLWTISGQKRLQALLEQLPAHDVFVITQKREELKQLEAAVGSDHQATPGGVSRMS